MSKKSKLKRQAEKQLEQKRRDELDEQLEKEKALRRGSMAARKMRRSARRGYVNGLMIFFTLLMLAAFLYSGLFYGGVTIVGALGGFAELIPNSVAYRMIVGDALMLAGIIISFCGKHIMQGAFALTGSAVYLHGALSVINDLRERLDQRGVDPALYDMDKDYMKHYLPILVLTVFSLVILIYGIVTRISENRRRQKQRDNAPVKSIIES